jgi:hypothetical protein
MSNKSNAEQEGAQAFLDRKIVESNPYEKGKVERKEWYDGWYSERIKNKFKKVFEKFGITWE